MLLLFYSYSYLDISVEEVCGLVERLGGLEVVKVSTRSMTLLELFASGFLDDIVCVPAIAQFCAHCVERRRRRLHITLLHHRAFPLPVS